MACVVVGDRGVVDGALRGPFMGFPVFASSMSVATCTIDTLIGACTCTTSSGCLRDTLLGLGLLLLLLLGWRCCSCCHCYAAHIVANHIVGQTLHING